MDSLVQFDWELALGDTTLTREELERLAALKMPLVQVRGQWVLLQTDEIEAAIAFWEKKRAKDEMALRDALGMALGAADEVDGLPLQEVETSGWLDDLLRQLEIGDRLEELPASARLCGPASSLPAARLFLAGLFAQVGHGRLPGRRHGPGQDDPGHRPAAGGAAGKWRAGLARGRGRGGGTVRWPGAGHLSRPRWSATGSARSSALRPGCA